MIELLIALVILIIILAGCLWLSVGAMFEADDRADRAEESLASVRKAQVAVDNQIQQENNDYEDDQSAISGRHHFG